MSSSKIIPKSLAGGAKRWRPESVARVAEIAAPVETPQNKQEKLERELAQLREQARVEGHDEGVRQGFAAGAGQVTELTQLLESLRELMLDFEQNMANDVLSLSLEVAKQMLRQSLRVRPELVFAIIKEAALSFPDVVETPRLIIHPLDAELLRKVIAPALGAEGLPWKLTEDPSIERGGCRFQTAASEIDGTLDNRWRRIVAALGRDDAWLDLNL